MDRSRLLPPKVTALSWAAAVSCVGLALLPACKGEEVDCSTLDAAGNPLPSAMGSGRGVPGGDCAKTTDCPKSCICRDLGRCEVGPGGACVVGTEEHCKKSKICKMKGFCTLSNGACVAGSDAECAASNTCKRLGYCQAWGGICVKSRPE